MAVSKPYPESDIVWQTKDCHQCPCRARFREGAKNMSCRQWQQWWPWQSGRCAFSSLHWVDTCSCGPQSVFSIFVNRIIVFNRMEWSMFSCRMVSSDEMLACFFLLLAILAVSRMSTWGCHCAYDLLPVWPCASQQITTDNKQQVQQHSKRFHSNSHFQKKFWPKDREAEGPARIEREAQESRCHVIFVPCFFWIATVYAMHSKATNWTSDLIDLHLFSSEKHPVSSIWLPVACILMHSTLCPYYANTCASLVIDADLTWQVKAASPKCEDGYASCSIGISIRQVQKFMYKREEYNGIVKLWWFRTVVINFMDSLYTLIYYLYLPKSIQLCCTLTGHIFCYIVLVPFFLTCNHITYMVISDLMVHPMVTFR